MNEINVNALIEMCIEGEFKTIVQVGGVIYWGTPFVEHASDKTKIISESLTKLIDEDSFVLYDVTIFSSNNINMPFVVLDKSKIEMISVASVE